MLRLGVVRSKRESTGANLGPFQDPKWDAPLDVEREIEAIPPTAQIRGLFILPVAKEVKRLPAGTVAMRERYVPFQFYPLREHAQLLVDASQQLFPKLPIRQGLRKLGRGAPTAFVGSTLGRVMLNTSDSVHDAVFALAKAYELSLKPGRATVEEPGKGKLIVHLDDVYCFLDCHHVGAFEGCLKFANQRGRVRVCRHSSSSATLMIDW
jgi:uncharacterized protein (TIGR02265 family)